MILACLAALFLVFDAAIFSIFTPGADWAPLWVAGNLSWTQAVKAYDVELVSSLQGPLVGATSDRPFAYPPSALLLFAPLAAPPFVASYLLFGLLSVALFTFAARVFKPQPIMLLAAPPVVLAVYAGQPTILVVGLILLGLARLDRNEAGAGALFAVAAMIKPPLLLLAPVALAGGGYWRAIAAAGTTATAIGCLSIMVFGLDTWFAWLEALPKFKALVTEFAPLLRNAVTPHAMAVRMELPPYSATICAALVALPIAWFGFARTKAVHVRLVTLVGGGLLISPYAMNYELAALAPVVASVRFERPRDLVMPAIWAFSLFFTVSLAGLLAVYAWACFELFSQHRALAAAEPDRETWPPAPDQAK